MRLTRRGWIVLTVALILFVVGVNWLMAGRNVVCDWRGGFEPCAIESTR